jgi:hypothetical protein
LAETNPKRLYTFESTARGFNMFHDMYVTAKRARTQRAIFCGWWRNELYMADPESSCLQDLLGWQDDWAKKRNGCGILKSSTTLRSIPVN